MNESLTKPWRYLRLNTDPKFGLLRKKQEAIIETAEIKFLWSVADYISKDQIRSPKIKEELNTFNLNAKILKPR
jgi:hypothetical protein